jgi:hypothetical protein
VASTAGFFPGQSIVIDTESMQINTVDSATQFRVWRGGGLSGAVAHSSGATVRVAGNGLHVDGSNTTYRDFEVRNSYTQRDLEPGALTGQGCCGFYASTRGAGISQYTASGINYINLVVHDNLDGMFIGSSTSNTLVYNVISYNNGGHYYDSGEGRETGSGNGMYLENVAGYSRVYETISLNNFNLGAQLYGVSGAYVGGDVQGSVFAGSGSPLGLVSGGMLYGPDSQKSPTGVVNESHFWGGGVTFGYGAGIGTGTFTNNYLGSGGIDVGTVTALTLTGNKIFSAAVNVLTSQAVGYTWNNNTYYDTATSAAKFGNRTVATNQTFANWKTSTGWDASSSIVGSALPTTVIVRGNTYQAGRANIIVYAASNPASIAVNLSTIGLTHGQSYIIKNAFNWNGSNVATGVYNSSSPTVSVPLNAAAKSVATPVGMGSTPATTCPNFCMFVVVPQ